LTILRAVAANTCPGARIDNRYKGARVEPLDRPRLRHTRDWLVFIQRNAWNDAGVLRPAALNDAVAVGRIRRAQDREWQATMPKHGTRDLPSVQRWRQDAILNSDRQLIDVLSSEVVPHVVVAGTVLAAKLTWQG